MASTTTAVSKKLASVAKTLNEKSDQVNSIIEAANARLAELNLGVEVWLDGKEDEVLSWSGLKTRETRSGDAFMFNEIAQFGYCRLGDKWELAVKTLESQCFAEGEGPDPWPEPIESASKGRRSLLSCTRADRVKAIELLPKLLDAIQRRAETIIEAIVNAEERVAKL
jgi:hypothetical protein